MAELRKGSSVTWNWGTHKARGRIVERFVSDVSRKIEGKTIRRKASRDEPAFLIEQTDGGKVLKSGSEITRTGTRRTAD